MDHDVDVIGIVEGACAAFECGVVERPFRRGGFPDQLCEIAAIFCVTFAAAIRGEVELIPQ